MVRLTKLDWSIVIESLAFIAVLAITAYWEPDIRWLHFFQAWIYLAVIFLSLRHNRWGYFVGIAISAFWNSANLFVTTFFHAGRQQLGELLATGHLSRPDLFISVPAVSIHFLLILCCIWAYLRLERRRWTDAAKFLASAVASIAYFAAIMALFQPRYLGMFPRFLHPHLNL